MPPRCTAKRTTVEDPHVLMIRRDAAREIPTFASIRRHAIGIGLADGDVESPLVILVVERDRRGEGAIERLVHFRFEECIERCRIGVVPNQLRASGGRIGRMTDAHMSVGIEYALVGKDWPQQGPR